MIRGMFLILAPRSFPFRPAILKPRHNRPASFSPPLLPLNFLDVLSCFPFFFLLVSPLYATAAVSRVLYSPQPLSSQTHQRTFRFSPSSPFSGPRTFLTPPAGRRPDTLTTTEVPNMTCPDSKFFPSRGHCGPFTSPGRLFG